MLGHDQPWTFTPPPVVGHKSFLGPVIERGEGRESEREREREIERDKGEGRER